MQLNLAPVPAEKELSGQLTHDPSTEYFPAGQESGAVLMQLSASSEPVGEYGLVSGQFSQLSRVSVPAAQEFSTQVVQAPLFEYKPGPHWTTGNAQLISYALPGGEVLPSGQGVQLVRTATSTPKVLAGQFTQEPLEENFPAGHSMGGGSSQSLA